MVWVAGEAPPDPPPSVSAPPRGTARVSLPAQPCAAPTLALLHIARLGRLLNDARPADAERKRVLGPSEPARNVPGAETRWSHARSAHGLRDHFCRKPGRCDGNRSRKTRRNVRSGERLLEDGEILRKLGDHRVALVGKFRERFVTIARAPRNREVGTNPLKRCGRLGDVFEQSPTGVSATNGGLPAEQFVNTTPSA